MYKIIKLISGRDLSNFSFFDIFILFIKNFLPLFRGLLYQQNFVLIGPRSFLRHVEIGKGGRVFSDVKIKGSRNCKIRIGTSVNISSFSIIEVSKSSLLTVSQISIGNNCGFGEFAYINGVGGVKIGNDVIVGQYFSVHPQNHSLALNHSDLFRLLPTTEKGINVGNNVWIGAKVTLLDGTKIGNNTIVAAGSVVFGEFPDNVLIAGVPAKIKRKL
jgi:acetyltransferase-like isoleucine patch superfamily enzyme